MFDYNKTIAKFKQGGSVKLEASHELIMSIHGYIQYLMYKYHGWIFKNHYEDAISFCHLYLLDQIYLYDPDKSRFITWSRWYILRGLADFYGKFVRTVATSRRIGPDRMKIINIGVPDNISLPEYKMNNDPILILKLKSIIIDKFNEHHWDLWNDYCGFEDEKLTLRELSVKYEYNSCQAVHRYIVKIREYLKTKLDELEL